MNGGKQGRQGDRPSNEVRARQTLKYLCLFVEYKINSGWRFCSSRGQRPREQINVVSQDLYLERAIPYSANKLDRLNPKSLDHISVLPQNRVKSFVSYLVAYCNTTETRSKRKAGASPTPHIGGPELLASSRPLVSYSTKGQRCLNRALLSARTTNLYYSNRNTVANRF